MMYFGFFLLIIALVALVVGFMQRKKMNTILAAPFKPTGQVQGGAAGDGLISCQGAIQATQPLTAPCSGKPCLYYEIEIKQEWEKHVKTEDGVKKRTGKDSAHTNKTGSVFNVDDGSGPVQVDCSESVDAKLEKAFTEKKSYGWGDISFGNYSVHINRPSDGEKHAVATHCVEKILPVEGDIFVVGKLDGPVIRKRDGMLGKLMLAREGRKGLIGATKRNMMIGFIAGGLLLPTGGLMAALGEAPQSAASTCENMADGLDTPCMGRQYSVDDVTFPWTVTTEGDFRFESQGTGSDPVMRLWPSVSVRDASGGVVFSMSAPDGAPVQSQGHFVPGSYTIHVNDSHYGWASDLEGGAGFSLNITSLGGAAGAPAPAAGGGDSNFGTVAVAAAGFTPDPITAEGSSGGSVDAATLSPDCNGWVSGTPDHIIAVGADIPSLRVMAHGDVDITLVVQKPDGTYLCNDDSEGLNPLVAGAFPAGSYKVWIGSYEQGTNSAYHLGISELESIVPSSLVAAE